MIVDIVDKYRTDDNNPIKNLRLSSLVIYPYRLGLCKKLGDEDLKVGSL
jgi:hypothetical protein